MPIITFLSDFGLSDGYVGSVKGVILSINNNIKIVDITHDVKPYSIQQAAYTILTYYNYYPQNTIHLVVVDPGVGSVRFPLIIKTKKYYFVGPDNGIFSYIISKEKCHTFEIVPEKLERFYHCEISTTFHARDIFAPTAALLSKQISPEQLGCSFRKDLYCFDTDVLTGDNEIVAEIIYIDHFGNVVSGFSRKAFEDEKNRKIKEIIIKNNKLDSIKKTYSDVDEGEFLALWGSNGFLEISINKGNAAQKLGCRMNDDSIIIKLE